MEGASMSGSAQMTGTRPTGSEPTGTQSPGRAQIAARTLRSDRWWQSPLITFAYLLAFCIYATFRAFENGYYFAEPYLSPFYSPCLTGKCVPGSSGFGHVFGNWWPISPSILVLIFPLGFRLTCYYYRKAYYRSFWLSPPACAVAVPHERYSGETKFPLILQNIHRWFWYPAVALCVVLTYDAVLAFRNPEGQWGHMGLGTVILIINVALLSLYTFGCHACRHIIGGRLKHFSRHPLRYRAWTWVSKLNGKHMQFAWASLTWLAVSDIYVTLLAHGVFSDPRFF